MTLRLACWVAIVTLGAGCGGDDQPTCGFDTSFELGGDGAAAPLAVAAGKASAGRLEASELPSNAVSLVSAGDFVLANEKVAVIIEDVGDSDLYDPWGGRPVGLARMKDGALYQPADFGEFFVLTGRNSLMTTSVGVIADGSDGGPAVVRAVGVLHPTPFFEAITAGLFRDTYEDIPAAIDYVLQPGAEYVDIEVTYHSPRTFDTDLPSILHGFMFSYRIDRFAPGFGFDTDGNDLAYLGFIDDDATSYAYLDPAATLRGAINVSGFSSNFTDGFVIAACGETARTHARLIIGGPGLDGLVQTVARVDAQELRTVTGVVRDADGAPAAGVRVHAEAEAGGDYLTRATTDADGAYTLHVPAGAPVTLTAYRRGDALAGPTVVAAGSGTQDFDLAPTGTVHVTIADADSAGAIPARVQVIPTGDSVVPTPPANFGEHLPTPGRLHVEYVMHGEVSLRVPAGDWQVVVSRGYEYELYEQSVSVAADQTVDVAATLEHSVDTTGIQCGDFHIHTSRSADAEDEGADKLESAVADGLEIPVRSDHEWVDDFSQAIADDDVADYAFGMASVELTTMQVYGHFGVIPMDVDPSRPNQGTPLWQEFPTAAAPTRELKTMTPPELFAAVRARPEQPTIIINHPHSITNYFGYCGLDDTTGLPLYPDLWDEEFTAIEVFNDSGWKANFDSSVADWMSLLNSRRRVFAVGSSDSHGITTSPVGYPRTCLQLGTDDPKAIDARQVADAVATGHSVISGGIYLTVDVAGAGP
ncbi:MAG TPA: carboxypeptidase regulatory-like domain-containing protein, partial [Kofleriaceae bacterium]|nr:carboxypeptidase regulatory-like domain-containing protein [Kofleriaceae bacterium]